VQVGSEVLQGIPFIVEADRRRNTLKAREFRVVDDDVRVLKAGRAAMRNELSSQHP